MSNNYELSLYTAEDCIILCTEWCHKMHTHTLTKYVHHGLRLPTACRLANTINPAACIHSLKLECIVVIDS